MNLHLKVKTLDIPSMNSSSSPILKKQPSKLKRFLVPTGIILAGIVILIFMTLMAPKPHKKTTIAKIPLVEALEISAKNIFFEIESQGSVSPRTETTLVSEVAGQIKKVSDKFVVGGFFKKGEQLLEIDPISYEVALLQAQARLDGANAKLVEEKARGKQAEKEWSLSGRTKNNAPLLALRKPQLQQALADVKAAEADVKGANIKLQRTKITAPYDAMIKAKMVDIGQYVTTGTQLVKTFAVDYAEVRLPIKEQDLAYIDIPPMGQINQVGSQVELSAFYAGKIRKWSTFINRSEGVVDASSRVNYVVARINDPYGLLSKNDSANLLPIGTFVKAKIIGIETPNIIAIPRKAVRGAKQIYVIGDDKKLNVKNVEILRSDDKFIYIAGGLNTGEQVILTKLATVINGMSLRLKSAPLPENNSNQPNSDSIKPIEADGIINEQPQMASKKSIELDDEVIKTEPIKDNTSADKNGAM